MNTLKALLSTVFVLSIAFSALAQPGQQAINIYRVEVKTKKKIVKGTFQKNNATHLFIETNKGTYVPIPVKDVKWLKIKANPASKTLHVPRYDEDKNGDGMISQNETMTDKPGLGEQLAIGALSVGAQIGYHALSNKFKNQRVFKLNYKPQVYAANIKEISRYAVYYQATPQFQLESMEGLKTPATP